MKFNDLFELAIAKSQAPSLNKFALKLGLSSTSIRGWNNGTSLPNDNHLITLANLAGVQPEIVLLWGSSWRTEGEACNRFERMAREAENRFGFTSEAEKAA